MNGPPLYNQGMISPEDTKKAFTSLTDSRPPIDARTTALLIVDVQPEYWSECPAVRQDFPQFPTQMSNLIQHCRSQNAKCIWVRADYSFERSPWLQQFSRLHKGRIPPEVKPSSEWEEFAEPFKGEHVVTKTSWSSTSDTQLLDVLRQSGIDTVLVCGLITSVCVQHSAFGIFEAGFRTILVTDACADRGRARHEAALALYGDYMYELRSVASVQQELKVGGSVVTRTLETCFLSDDVIKPNDALSAKSTSTGSLTSLESSLSEEEEVVLEEKDREA